MKAFEAICKFTIDPEGCKLPDLPINEQTANEWRKLLKDAALMTLCISHMFGNAAERLGEEHQAAAKARIKEIARNAFQLVDIGVEIKHMAERIVEDDS